jgi:hypothetical protein
MDKETARKILDHGLPSMIKQDDPVNHPSHYTAHPSGIECIEVAEHFTFALGSSIKYIWRAGLKSTDPIQDLRKAAWFLNREIERLEKQAG